MAMTDNKYLRVPKPEPTPIFDSWKHCPMCKSEHTELRVEYNERSASTDDKDIQAVAHKSQSITLHFYCIACDLESEHRVTQLDDMRE